MPWISRKELDDIYADIRRLERKVEALEPGAFVSVSRGSGGYFPPYSLPVAEAVGQVIEHLGMRFEYKQGTPERAVLRTDKTRPVVVVDGSAVPDAPKT